jgi:Putative transposase/Transposase zinc-binding domain
MALARPNAAPGSQSLSCACAQACCAAQSVPHCPVASLQEIFRQHFAAYAASHVLHPRQARAAFCISNCFGPALGTHVLRCPLGHFQQVQPHACRHRCCPQCAEYSRSRWTQPLLARLLPCPHNHAIFTLPHELLLLWEFNRELLSCLFFDCVRQSLLTLLADPHRLGATPGLMMSLHTWGRDLSHHPHIHCLVTSGGLSPLGQWVSCPDPRLLPFGPLRALLRGKLLGCINALLRLNQLCLPPWQDSRHWYNITRLLYRKHWALEIRPAYPYGDGVALYLARYAKGGPITKERPLDCRDGLVRMSYTSHRDGARHTLALPVHEFIARVLWHAPAPGLHTTRYAGLYSSALADGRARAREQLLRAPPPTTWPRPAQPPKSTGRVAAPALCPLCSAALLRLPDHPVQRQDEFSLYRPLHPARSPPNTLRLGAVQPFAQVDALRQPPPGRSRTTSNCPSAASRRPPQHAT